MSNRQFAQFRYSPEKKPVDLFAECTFSNGDISLTASSSKGVASASGTGGDYTLTLDSSYYRVMDVHATWLDGTYVASVPIVTIKARTANTVEILTCSMGDASGALLMETPNDTATLLLRITCSASGVA